jgi:diguanylate cyclase (GGDEF)-like protein/PAS domain S-box-containing protein
MTTTATASAKSSESGFQLITESIPHIVWTAAPDGSTLYFNRQATIYAGSRGARTGHWDWLPLVHPDQADHARIAWELAMNSTAPCHLDLRLRRSDGHYRWHALHCSPVHDADHELVEWIGTATDIDDAKHRENSLCQAERQSTETLQLLELLQSKAPVGFGFVDRNFTMMHLNETLAAAVSGKTVDDLLGRSVPDIVPEMWPELEVSYRRVLDEGLATLNVEIDGPSTPDPADRHRYLTSHYPVKLDGEIIGIGLVVVDITARTRAEAALRFQAELLAAAGQAIVAVDVNRIVIYWNRAAEEMYGWTAAEAIGRPSVDLIRRTEAADRDVTIVDQMVGGQTSTGDYDVTLRDGRLITVFVTNTPVFDPAGTLVAVIGSSIDITERKTAEATSRHLASIVDGSGDAIFGTTTDGIVTSWNPAAVDLFGYTAEEIIGRQISTLAPGDRALEQSGMRARLQAVGGHEHLETMRRCKDGTMVDVLITASTSTDETGTVVGMSVIARDITERIVAQRALEASRRRLAEAQRTAQLGSFELDVVTGELTWSEEYCRIMGLDPNVTPKRALFVSMVHPDDVAAATATWASAERGGRSIDLQFRIIRPDSQVRSVLAHAVPEIADDGSVLRVVGTMMDNTDQVEAERVKRAAELRFEIGFEQSAIGTAIAGLDGIPIRVNPAACLFFERPETELVGLRWTGYTHPDEIPLGQAVLSRLADGHDTYQDERRYVRPDGSVVWALTHVTVVRDEHDDPEYFFVQLQDITARKLMEQELAHQALHDSLTGLPNRALLTDRLVQGLARAQRRGTQLAVMFLDIDQFKIVNDSLGHSAGDDLLRHAAARIAGTIRPGDTVARFGGDEFVVVCDDVTPFQTEHVAERVLEALSYPWNIGTQEMHITASLGIAIADRYATPESLLRDSDAAMYLAKERGRGRIEMFDEALRFKANRRLATASALHGALDREEFVVLYQPVVDLTTGMMVSAEALVRWNHPEHGLVTPQDFISVAEETGIIVPIGALVLERACRDLANWQQIATSVESSAATPHRTNRLSINVNLSVRQMLAPDIARLIEGVLERTGVAAGDLCLELTESVFMEDVAYFERTLGGLKALGVDLSIDDFGTGYSSLSYLKLFPVDGVKVDRVFVDGLGTDPHDTALVAAIVAMASALDLQVTAEGVETREQLHGLKALGVPRAQGFYLARPMPAAEIADLVARSHRWDVE